MNQIIGQRYQIADPTTDRIGRGGMGDVYCATDQQTGKTVAIKHLRADVMTLDATSVQRFAREGEALRRLNHPNIVAVLDTIEEAGEHYIVMEYVPGGSLRELLGEAGQLPLERVLQIGLELADALTRAHHLHIIHRDIKPANVLLAADGTPRLTDFGVAHMGDLDRITETGLLTGTYAYVSPEACQGVVIDGRADIWSFGVVLYEMLAGRRPFEEAQLAATITAILTRPTPDLAQFRPDVPESLAALVYRMLEKERSRRVSSVRLVGAQLEAIIAGSDELALAVRPRFETTPGSSPTPVLGPRHNLPTQSTPFIGRAPEVAEIVNLLCEPECRLLTLVGPGGMGKTRLALEAARQVVDEFRHGVRFVPLAPIDSPELMVTAVADALNFTFPNQDDQLGQLVAYLHEKEMLLVLDNFEHVIAGADLCSTLLAEAPGLQLLVTSRETLNLWEEWTRPIHGMRYPTQVNLDTDIEPYSAVRLFADRAHRMRSGFSLATELPHVIRICQLVEGMPLGIELAATWLRVLSPEQIISEIEKNYDFLATNMRNIPERHRSLRAVFDYSWQLLTEVERQVFRRLAVFRGGFTRQAAEMVVGASLLTLTGLVNKSLLAEEVPDGNTPLSDTTSSGSQRRYTLHELLRQYAAEKLVTDAAETAVTTAAHAHYYSHLLGQHTANLQGRNQKVGLDVIGADLENGRAAWGWSVSHLPDGLENLQVAAHSLYIYFDNRGRVHEGIDLFMQAATAVAALPETPETQMLLAHLLIRQAIFQWRASQNEASQTAFDTAVVLLRPLMETHAPETAVGHLVRRDLALALAYGSVHHIRTGNWQLVKHHLAEAADICRATQEHWALLRVLNIQANTSFDYDERRRLYQEGIALAQEIGDEIYQALIIHNVVNYAAESDELEPMVAECVAIHERLGNAVGLAMTYGLMSAAAARHGRYLDAKIHIQKGIAIYQDIASTYYLTGALQDYAYICWAFGELDEVEAILKQRLTLEQQSGDPEAMIKTMTDLGVFLLEAYPTPEEARRYYKMSLALLPQLHNPRQKAEALDSLGNFALALGEYGEAKKHFEAAIPCFEATENSSGVAWALRNFGLIALALGDYETATARFEESLKMHQANNHVYGMMDLYNDLGRVAFACHNDSGAALCYGQALALPQNPWTVASQMSTMVDWGQLLLKVGQKEEALRVITAVTNHPRFVPPLPRRTRDKAARLLAELEAALPAETVAHTKRHASQSSLADVAQELLHLPSPT